MLMLFSAPENVQRKLVYETHMHDRSYRRLPFGHETYRQKILEHYCTIRLTVQSSIRPLLTQSLTTRGELTKKKLSATPFGGVGVGAGAVTVCLLVG